MGQLLRIAAAIIAIWLLLRLIKRLRAKFTHEKPASKPFPDSKKMLPCASCGIFVPEAQAIMYRGRPYCSHEHIPKDKGE